MHSQIPNLFFRDLPVHSAFQDLRHIAAPLIHIGIALFDVLQHGILNIQIMGQPNQSGLQMSQKSLYKLIILFQKIRLVTVKGINHIIDQLLQPTAFKFDSGEPSHLYLFMLGTLYMKADIGNLHLRYLNAKSALQFLHQFFGQQIILIFLKLLHPVFCLLDGLIFQNPINRNGNVDHQPQIGILSQIRNPVTL